MNCPSFMKKVYSSCSSSTYFAAGSINHFDMFEGEWKDDRKHGKGTYIGELYSGEFKDGHGKMHGKGIYNYASGSVYDGEWKDSMMHGKGILIEESMMVNGKMIRSMEKKFLSMLMEII